MMRDFKPESGNTQTRFEENFFSVFMYMKRETVRM